MRKLTQGGEKCIWGKMTEPIALEDREPQPTDLDEEDCCWWWDDVRECYERFCGDTGGIANIHNHNKMNDYPHYYTHWLPHWVIKQPSEKK